MTYYAITDANGPISVRIEADTDDAAVAALDGIDPDAVDDARTDAEDDLGIELANPTGHDATQRLGAALRALGARLVHVQTIVTGVSAAIYADPAGWTLYGIEETGERQWR